MYGVCVYRQEAGKMTSGPRDDDQGGENRGCPVLTNVRRSCHLPSFWIYGALLSHTSLTNERGREAEINHGAKFTVHRP